MTTLELLKAARELISDPARWTQEAPARDPVGRMCRVLSADAVRWSGPGAIYRGAGGDLGAHKQAVEQLHRDLPFPLLSIEDVNDLGHADLLALFDRTIARLESEAA